jgi:hypothetical protein
VRCDGPYAPALTAVIAVAITIGVGSDFAAGQTASTDFGRCLTIADSSARLRCFDNATKLPPQPQPNARDMGAWRLVRTPDPRGGPEAVSIMHTADLSRSDIDLAGLMLRCADSDIEVLIIVVEPRPPRARPRIKLGAPGNEASYEATVAPPFTALLLPQDATSLVTTSVLRSAELSIEIDGEKAPVRGVVALTGLRSALDGLRANCPRR